jgi:hypothetical protein
MLRGGLTAELTLDDPARCARERSASVPSRLRTRDSAVRSLITDCVAISGRG